jgi:hypothetical protein
MFKIIHKFSRISITPGRTHILWDCKYDKLLRKLKPRFDAGHKTLLFTRHHPRFIKFSHDNLEIIWVSSELCVNSLPPKNEYIMRKVDSFLTIMSAKSLILFDVFEYLATPEIGDFNSTLELLRQMVDKTAVTDSVHIVPISSKSFDERHRAMIMGSGVG